jgi:hypothetical protein
MERSDAKGGKSPLAQALQPISPNHPMSELKKIENLNFQVAVRRDDNIEFKFLDGDKERFMAVCEPSQIGAIATGLLSAASNSAQLVGPAPPKQQPGPITIDAAIPVSNWYFGETKTPGQRAVVIEIGKTRIGLLVTDDQMRALGQTIVGASWKTRQASSISLGHLLKEFGSDLRAWWPLALDRVTAPIRLRATLIFDWITGRSFRTFRTILIGPDFPVQEYPRFGKCIYCDEIVYSHDPRIRKTPLGAEHIIAEGLGGTVELQEASCQKCEEATGAVVEGDILGRTMKAIRVHLNLKKSGSGPHPKVLPLPVTGFGQQGALQIPIEDYPIVFSMFAYAPPNIDAADGMPMVTSAVIVRIKHDPQALFQKYGVTAFASAHLDNVMMCRMLAKIGHALAVAEVGKEKFSPALVNLIRKGDERREMRFIGGTPISVTVPPNTLHYLALGYQKIKAKVYVVAHIRLFAGYGAPTYTVMVGESLESRLRVSKEFYWARFLEW